MSKMSEMSKFDFSAEALDKGLSDRAMEDFENAASVFEAQSARVTYEGADAENVADAHAAWLSVGGELLKLFGQAQSALAVRRAKKDEAKKVENPEKPRSRLRNILATKWASLRGRVFTKRKDNQNPDKKRNSS